MKAIALVDAMLGNGSRISSNAPQRAKALVDKPVLLQWSQFAVEPDCPAYEGGSGAKNGDAAFHPKPQLKTRLPNFTIAIALNNRQALLEAWQS